MSWPANEPQRRWLFVVELEAGTDPLLRALGHFPAQNAEIATLSLRGDGDYARLEVEVLGLDEVRAQRLRTRLAAAPSIRSVGAGWRQEEQA